MTKISKALVIAGWMSAQSALPVTNRCQHNQGEDSVVGGAKLVVVSRGGAYERNDVPRLRRRNGAGREDYVHGTRDTGIPVPAMRTNADSGLRRGTLENPFGCEPASGQGMKLTSNLLGT
jgi:hypothetical protein